MYIHQQQLQVTGKVIGISRCEDTRFAYVMITDKLCKASL